VAAPPEMEKILEEIRRESDVKRTQEAGDTLGVDPELDEFMVPPFQNPQFQFCSFFLSPLPIKG